MANTYFQFKEFTIHQDRCAMKVTTDACLFGAWCAAEILKEALPHSTLLDIGTGTGLLSLMVAQKNPTIMISAVEIDTDAYEQAAQNVAQSAFGKSIQLYNTDIKKMIVANTFDIIMANPPFYQQSLKAATHQKNVALHSEALELKEVLNIISNNLQPEGFFYLLLPYYRLDEVMKLINAQNLVLYKTVLVQQSAQHNYFRIMLQGGFHKKDNILKETICITHEDKQYTEIFIALLKEYYLYL